MSGVKLEKTESNAEEREEGVDGWNSSGHFKECAEHVIDELGEEGGDDGGADQGAGQAGEGAEGDGEVDPGTEKGQSPRGGSHRFLPTQTFCRSQNATIPRTQPIATSLGSFRKARCSAPLTAVFCYQACAKVYQEIVCTDERARPSLENQIAEISEREQGFQHCDKSFRSSEKNNFFLQSYFFCNI